MHEGSLIGRRRGAQGRVHEIVTDGITALKDLELAGGELGGSSGRALESLRKLLAGELSHSLTEVGVAFEASIFDLLEDPDESVAERQRQARILVEHMRNGITALLRIRDGDEPELRALNGLHLQQLAARLAR